MTLTTQQRSRRADFIKKAAVTGIGLALAGAAPESAAAADIVPGNCTDTLSTIIATVLMAERLAVTLYYTALTTPAVMRDQRLGGRYIDPNAFRRYPSGNFHHIRYLQAALDAETKHATLLVEAGARSSVEQFYFPTTALTRLGTTTEPESMLGVLETLETAFVDAYAVAVSQFLQLGHGPLAGTMARIMGVEAEHRALGRAIAGVTPANDVTLERVPYACVSDVGVALRPFITGQGFRGGATRAIPVPTAAQVARIVGAYGTRLVRSFI